MKSANKKYILIITAFLIVVICAFGILNWEVFSNYDSCTLSNKKSRENIMTKLLSNHKGDDLYSYHTDNFNFLIEQKFNDTNNVKSIAIYRYSTVYQKYLLNDSAILDKRGKAVMSFRPSDSGFYRTYYFYDNNDNPYLDITIGSNNYDTTYTLRKFDRYNLNSNEIKYNITRKEYEHIHTTEIIPNSDSTLNLKYAVYWTDIDTKNVLPFETREIRFQLLNDSVIEAITSRVVQSDTLYNSSYIELYRITNNTLIPFVNKSKYPSIVDTNWVVLKNEDCDIKRSFSFYEANEKSINNEFPIKQSVITYLNIQSDSILTNAWTKYKENLNDYSKRKKTLDEELGIDSIELKESLNVGDFTPHLWYIVSQDSGFIDGYNNKCFAVGYNTPIKNDNEFNIRCLAIYERINSKYILRKQSFGALEDFIDDNKDLLFNGLNEQSFDVNIENGNVIVSYNYMRGEASYTFTHNEGKWLLLNFESSHRTCCKSEHYSYDYTTKKYSFSEESNDGNSPSDTSLTMIQERPIIYMDSLNIRAFDYNETGLLVK